MFLFNCIVMGQNSSNDKRKRIRIVFCSVWVISEVRFSEMYKKQKYKELFIVKFKIKQ